MNNISCFSEPPQAAQYIASSWLFDVLEFSPRMGRSGTVMNVNILYHNPTNSKFLARIVFGFEPVYTLLHSLEPRSQASWSCTATAIVPEFEVHKNLSTHTVNVSIEAVKDNVVCDSVTFGYFTYLGKYSDSFVGVASVLRCNLASQASSAQT